MGTWIEIVNDAGELTHDIVVPLVGTWIEIVDKREKEEKEAVVPLVGTWIEIYLSLRIH